MKKLIFVSIALLFFACSKSGEKKDYEKLKPKASLETPDIAVKSFWAHKIWQDTTSFYNLDTTLLEYYSSPLKKHILENYNKEKNELRENHFFNKNMIDKVNVESESRAIVITKEFTWKGSDKYEEYKYIFSRQDDKWFIEDILKVCWNCNGVGEATDYAGGYPYMNKTCKHCNGSGWKSQFYRNE